MSFVEFIGVVISIAAMIFLVIKRVFEEQQRRRNPEEYARKEKLREQNLRRLMKSRGIDLGMDEEEEEETLPLPPPPRVKFKPPTPQHAFNNLRNSQKLQAIQPKKSSPITFQDGNYGRETASAKRQSFSASETNPADSYEVYRIEKISPGNRLISSLKSPRDMLVIKEIFDKPLSMRDQR